MLSINNSKPTYQKGDVLTIKLSNGEELLGKMKEDTLSVLVMESLYSVNVVPNAQGHVSVGLAPFMMTANSDEFHLDKSNIICYTEASSEAKSHFIKTDSSLEIPANGIITS